MKRISQALQMGSFLPEWLPFVWLCTLFLMGMLVGCAPLPQLQHANSQPKDGVSTFRAHLAREYASYAESEGLLGRLENRDYFARKGLRALKADDVQPESLDEAALSPEIFTELRTERDRLLGVRTEFLERVASQNVARAQLFFDCWARQSAMNNADKDALPCRQSFQDEMRVIQQVIAAIGTGPDVTLPVEYTVLFAPGNSDLSHDGEFAIEQALAISTLYPDAKLTVTGHADRTGSPARNLQISQARADTVKVALVAVGIQPEAIDVRAAGEDDLATPTLDGIARERNRRVSIRIHDAADTAEPENHDSRKTP